MNSKYWVVIIIFLGAVLAIIYSVSREKVENSLWAKMYLGAGSVSSPRAIDLNQDGILDLVMGAGAEEFSPTEYAVLAINGDTGDVLWKVEGINQMVGSPLFRDITNDSVPDVFIGGRSAQFLAINGKTGEVIWRFLESYEGLNLKRDRTLLNFFNPQLIPDQNGDNFEDLLVSFGGLVSALPGDANRPAGKLMVLDLLSGSILAEMEMPDGKETYLSPLVHDFNGDGQLSVLFGSGGETIAGKMYKIALSDLVNNNHKAFEILDSSRVKGYIAPPTLADVNGDDIADIIICSMNGRIMMIDGASGKKIWENEYATYAETESMAVPGDVDGDGKLEIFATIGLGSWPAIDTAIHVLLSAATGEELYKDTLGIMQLASAVSYDMDDDGNDEFIQYVNGYEDNNHYDKYYVNWIQIYNFDGDESYKFSPVRPGANIGSTPLVTDLDNDGNTDFIFCYITEDRNLTKYTHLIVERIEMNIAFKDSPWRGYMSTNYNGHYEKKK